jgi:Ca2+-binding EF-hand superfamily protein
MSSINLDDQVRKAVEEIYKQYDTDKSGFLEGNEIVSVVNDVFFSLGNKKQVTNEDVKRIMQVIDTNNDGKISKDELFLVVKRCTSK